MYVTMSAAFHVEEGGASRAKWARWARWVKWVRWGWRWPWQNIDVRGVESREGESESGTSRVGCWASGQWVRSGLGGLYCSQFCFISIN